MSLIILSEDRTKERLERLRQDSVSVLYKLRLSQKLQRTRRVSAEELYADIKKGIQEVADKAIAHRNDQ